VFVKICGITSEDDALLSVALGADAVGFIFAPSKRQLSRDRARDIARRLPPEVLTVGVFRDELPAVVIDTVNRAGLRAAQLHGQESPEGVAEVASKVPVVIKAFPANAASARRAASYDVDAVLVDSDRPGSGELADWSALEAFDRRTPLLLAGGLDAANVAEAIARVRPWGVDVASGVEASPGRKDPRKVREFISAAKSAGRALADPDITDPDIADPDAPFDWQEHP
jgi:phosphoribosylanthranilate isomerase